jgi:hypothetical protein
LARQINVFLGRSHYEITVQAFAGQSSIACYADRPFVRPDRGEASMRPQAVVPANESIAEAKYTVLTGLMKRFGSGRFARALFKAPTRNSMKVVKNRPDIWSMPPMKRLINDRTFAFSEYNPQVEYRLKTIAARLLYH